ncbi:Glycoside hydrolase family 47 - like 6 [Theobroma cacao]|nr:Glycoside hydrolase family 47 - like 6 [Theobroma cacao]
MGKKSSSSSSSWWRRGGWRYLHPSCCLKRPKRLAFIIFVFISLNYFLWDRRTLSSAHQRKVTTLNQQVTSLQNQVLELKSKLRGSGVEKKIIEIGDDDDDNNNIKKQVAKDDGDPINIERRQKVKDAMLHAWNSYEKYAWGQDELQPQTKNGVDSFGGLGATLVDSLDTLFIMGLQEQFHRAREWVANSLDFNKDYEASVFETTIRLR